MRHPADSILRAESANYVAGEMADPTYFINVFDAGQLATDHGPGAAPWHAGGCNVLWVDGHVTTEHATNPDKPTTIYNALGEIAWHGKPTKFPCHWLIR